MWDVGCDRMVFAINSELFLIKCNAKFNEWSLDQGQKTINPLIPSFRKDYRATQSTQDFCGQLPCRGLFVTFAEKHDLL